MSRTAASPTSTVKARRTLAASAATVRMATVPTVVAEIAVAAGVRAAAAVDAAAADVAGVTAEAAVVAATVAAADRAADATNRGRLQPQNPLIAQADSTK
jgi:hypothetical protein